VKVSTSGGAAQTRDSSGDGTSRTEIIVAVLVALLVGAAARLLIRRRAARSAMH
jgi:MYXO-CTERM domain-containing protein